MTTKQRAASASSSSPRQHASSSSGDAKAPRRHKKRASEYSRNHDTSSSSEAVVVPESASDSSSAWESFTSPDGRAYYYNKATQESRWKLPKELRNATKPQKPTAAADASGDRVKLKKQTELERADESRHVVGSKTRIGGAAGTLVSDTPDTLVSSGSTPKKNALVQRLQASLAGRINPMANMGPPPMIHIPRGDSHSSSNPASSSFPGQESSDTHGGIGTENGGGVSEEQQYEAETAHMTAAERLRFLRKKRQETMFAKEKIVEEDDFMKEFERNMTKKHDGSFDWRKKREAQHAKEREAKEKELETKAKEREAKEREREAKEKEREAKEKQKQKEREREKEYQEAAERKRQEVREEEDQEAAERKRQQVQDEEKARETVKSRARTTPHTNHNENGKVDDVVVVSEEDTAEELVKQGDATEENEEDQHQQLKRNKHRRHSEHHDTANHDEIAAGDANTMNDEEAVAEQERQRLKQERRERRRIAKLEAEVAVQSLESSPVEKTKKTRKQSAHEDNVGAGEATEQQHQYQQQQQQPYSGEMYQQFPPSPYGYPPASIPPHSTGGSCSCCRPHPFVPVHVPQMPPFPMYYPYAQPPPPVPMMMMMGGYASQTPPMLIQGPPLSQPGMALVPFAQGQLAAYGGAGYGVCPTLDRCEGCKGSGVGLVEKNGFCHHCNRLRLDFIVASARIRQRCSVCSGWGLGLVQPASGKCDHCSRGAPSVSPRRQSSGETHQFPPGAVATPFASSEAQRRSGSARAMTMAGEIKKLESIEWDQSSDDGSEWDE